MALKLLYNEIDLLIKISKGDEHALAIFLKSHSGHVYSFALKLTRSRELAEEVVQDVFLNIWLSRSKLDEVHNAEAYLNRITRNVSLNVLRKIARSVIIAGVFEDDAEYPDDNTRELLDLKDSQWILQQAIDKLPKQQKKVYQLCHEQGLTYDQAAAQLEISCSTVNFHIKEALKNIRKSLKEMGISTVLFTLMNF